MRAISLSRRPVGTAYMLSLWTQHIITILLAWGILLFAGTMNKRFHPDEALYTTFARNAFVHGDWLLTSPLDKPPLSIYANAISQALFGGVMTDKGVYDLPIRVGEFVAKIPNLFAGLVTVAIFMALEKKLFSKQSYIGSLCLIASPLFIGLSASAFTDSLMLMWVMGAWLAIERRQSFLSGFLLMVGFATKPQAIFFLPLLIMRGITPIPPSPFPHQMEKGGENPSNGQVLAPSPIFWGGDKYFTKTWLKFGMGMIIPLVSLLAWDVSRGTTSIFALGQYNYPTTGLIYDANNWGSRLWAWLGYLFFGMNPFILILTGITVLTFMVSLNKPTSKSSAKHMSLFIILYSGLHIVLGIPLYDRYVLLIIPITIFIIRHYLTLLAVGGMMIFSPLFTIYIGRDFYPPDTEGLIIMLADEINALPFGAIVYDHWRGWELGYYLGAWSDKRRVYYPDPYTLAQDSLNNPDMATRYFIVPSYFIESSAKDYEVWLSALRDVGYEVTFYKQITKPLEIEFAYMPTEFYIIFALKPPPH